MTIVEMMATTVEMMQINVAALVLSTIFLDPTFLPIRLK